MRRLPEVLAQLERAGFHLCGAEAARGAQGMSESRIQNLTARQDGHSTIYEHPRERYYLILAQDLGCGKTKEG